MQGELQDGLHVGSSENSNRLGGFLPLLLPLLLLLLYYHGALVLSSISGEVDGKRWKVQECQCC